MILLVDAGGVVLAGSRCTLVDVDLTVVSLETRHTEAVELCHCVHADGSVLAGLRRTLVHIFRAGLAVKSRRAVALETLWLQLAGSVVLAGSVHAVGHTCSALPSSISLRTPAEIPIGPVHTQRAGRVAGVALALVDFLCAVVARESVRADAGVPCRSRDAGAIFTWCKRASVVQLVTVLPHVSHTLRGTDAGVVVHGVHARRSVVAGRRQAPV